MAKATEKAVYYDQNLKGKTFDVLKRNDDGTVDIGENGKTVVRVCPVVEKPKHGHCTLGSEPVEVAEKEETQTAADAATAAKLNADQGYKPKI